MSLRKILVPVLLSLVIGCLSSPLPAQNPPTAAADQIGLQPYESYNGGDIDSVSLTTGTLNLNAPFLSYPQRGKLHLSFNLLYNNAWQHLGLITCPQPPATICIWYWGYGSWVSPPFETSDAFIANMQSFSTTEFDFDETNKPRVGDDTWYAKWSLQTADGSKHPLANLGTNTLTTPVSCGSGPCEYFGQESGPFRTLDATGWLVYGTFTASSPSTPHGALVTKIVGPDGVSYRTPNAFEEDPNGNLITLSSGIFLDSLGRQISPPPGVSTASNTDTSGCPQAPQVPLSVDHAVLWSVPGPQGGNTQYKFCYANGSTNIPPYNNGSNGAPAVSGASMHLQSIVLPNGQTWNFEYNDPGDGSVYNGSPINYGTLTKVTLPTGGTISYTYVLKGAGDKNCQNGGRWVATRTVNANDGTGPHTWTYNYTTLTTTTVTDPLGNYQVHTFSNLASQACAMYETQVQHYQQGGDLPPSFAHGIIRRQNLLNS